MCGSKIASLRQRAGINGTPVGGIGVRDQYLFSSCPMPGTEKKEQRLIDFAFCFCRTCMLMRHRSIPMLGSFLHRLFSFNPYISGFSPLWSIISQTIKGG